MTNQEIASLSADEKRALLAEKLRERKRRRFPASIQQQRIWFLDQLKQGDTSYNLSRALRVTGDFDVDRWRAAIGQVVARHEGLRTTFTQVDGAPMQVVHERLDPEFIVVDAPELAGPEGMRDLESVAVEEFGRPFDLTAGPLLRMKVLRLSDTENVMLITIHHITADLWSTAIFISELVECYRAIGEGVEPQLEKPRIHYVDYSEWQAGKLEDGAFDKDLGYWREALEGLPAALELPTDRPRPAVQTTAGGSVGFELPEPTMDALREMVRDQGVTPFMAVLAAFASILHRYSGADDLVVGVPTANRDRAELAQSIGYFVNMLPMRLRFADNPSYADLLRQARTVALGAFGHQDLPFERLVETLAPVRDASRTPVFQVSFIYQNIPMQDLAASGVTFETIEIGSRTARFDLELQVFDGSSLTGAFEYNSDLFDAETIEHLSRQLGNLIEGVIANPERPVSEIPLLDESDEARLAAVSAGPERTWPDPLLTHERISEQAAKHPDSIALRFVGETVTYGDLERRSNQLAQQLRREGIDTGKLVGICVERGPRMIVAALAVLKAGAAFVPLDPGFPPERITYMLEDSGLALLISESGVIDLLGLETTCPTLLLDQREEALSDMPAESPGTALERNDPAYVLYTSGYTGNPKGVVVPHGALDNFLRSMQERPGFTSDDVLLAVTTFSFDIVMLEILLPLVSGGSLVIASRVQAVDGSELAKLLQDEAITIMQATPITWQMLLEAGWRGASGFKVLVGGEALPQSLADALLEQGLDVWNMYGPTETTIWSSTADVTPGPVHIGEPIANTQFHVLDEARQRVPFGVPGELWIGGDGVATGYLGRPELNAERFVPDPFSSGGARMYRTGDLVRRRHDGRLDFLGRTDFQVKLHGYRIELGEIEAALEEHPSVARAVVAVREDEATGARLVAYLTASEEVATSEAHWDEEVERWQQIWDSAYAGEAGETSATTGSDDVSGWASSVTGAPIPEAQMTRWADDTAQRILDLHPRTVLEIGSGTGLIMSRLLGHVDQYWGVDTAPTSVANLRARAETMGATDRVRIEQMAAHQIGQLPEQRFDVVVINSVAQYFPDERYLRAVLDAALQSLAPGGAIFVGDVRSLPLLRAFHTEVALHDTAPDSTAAELKAKIARSVEDDAELVIAPALFTDDLMDRDDVAAVSIVAKDSGDDNEMVRFRYDVIVTKASDEGMEPVAVDWQHWDDEWSLERLAETLAGDGDLFAIAGIPNARVEREVRLLARLEDEGAESARTLLEKLDGEPTIGVSPHGLVETARRAGWEPTLDWSAHGADGRIALIARHLDADGQLTGPPPAPRSSAEEAEAWSGPRVNGAARRRLQMAIGDIRAELRDRLPQYMVPTAFMVLDAFPTTPNGKINRRALPAPEKSAAEQFVAPRNEIEMVLADIWAEVLGVERVGVRDNFFDLGGHSLLSTRVVVRVKETFGFDVPLHRMFTEPTVEALAVALLEISPDPGHTTRTAELIVEMSSMSDEEVAAALGGADATEDAR